MAQRATKSTRPKKPATKTLPPLPAEYISNPFGLIRPSMRAIGVNVWLLLGLVVASVAIIVVMLAAFFVGAVAFTAHHPGIAVVAGIVALILAVVVAVALAPILVTILLASARRRRARITWRLVVDYGPRMLGVGILSAIATLIGLVLLIIPGLIVGTWLSLAIYVVAEEDAGVMESLRRSRELVRGHVFEMWGLYGLNSFLSIIPLIGGLISIVFSVLTLPAPALRYLQLKQLEAEPEKPKPKTHWANYLVIVLVVLGIFWSSYQRITHPSRTNPANYSGQGVGTGTGY